MNKKLLFLAGLAPLVAAPALVVASCSSSTTDNSKQQANEAANRAKTYLESKSYLYADKKPSELKEIVALAALKRSQNFGFTTQFSNDSANDKEDDGIKSIKIVTKRGDVTSDPVTATLKVKSAKADETDDKTKVDELLNLDKFTAAPESTFAAAPAQPTMRRSTVFVRDYIDKDKAPKASEISTYIDYVKNNDEKWLDLFLREATSDPVMAPAPNNKDQIGWKSLVKKEGKDKIGPKNFEIVDIWQTKVGSILAPSITFNMRLKSDPKEGEEVKTSGIVQVNLVGFQLDPAYKEQVKTLFDQATTEFGSLYNPIIDESKTASVKASSVTDDKALVNYLLPEWDVMGGDLIVPIQIKPTITKIVSANDSEGSLKVLFKFERTGDGAQTTPLSVEKEITLFGFQRV